MSSFTLYPFSSSPRVPFRFDGRILYTSDRLELIRLTLLPGEGMEPHTQPMEVIFFVIEGTGFLVIDDEAIEIHTNTTVHVAAGAMRAWSNHGREPLRLLVNKLL